MGLTLNTAPANSLISAYDLQDHLRIDAGIEDAVLTRLIAVATAALDGKDGLLGRALLTQKWRLTLDFFPKAISIPLPPLQAVESITYLDLEGTTQTLAPALYTIVGDGDTANVLPFKGTTWPQTWDFPGSVSVLFRAGYGDIADKVPAPIRQAALLQAATLFQNRESIYVGTAVPRDLPDGLKDLVAPYRIWGF